MILKIITRYSNTWAQELRASLDNIERTLFLTKFLPSWYLLFIGIDILSFDEHTQIILSKYLCQNTGRAWCFEDSYFTACLEPMFFILWPVDTDYFSWLDGVGQPLVFIIPLTDRFPNPGWFYFQSTHMLLGRSERGNVSFSTLRLPLFKAQSKDGLQHWHIWSKWHHPAIVPYTLGDSLLKR